METEPKKRAQKVSNHDPEKHDRYLRALRKHFVQVKQSQTAKKVSPTPRNYGFQLDIDSMKTEIPPIYDTGSTRFFSSSQINYPAVTMFKHHSTNVNSMRKSY